MVAYMVSSNSASIITMNSEPSYKPRSSSSGSTWAATPIRRWRSAWLAIALLLAPMVSAAPILHSNPFADSKIYLDTTTHPWIASDNDVRAVFQVVVSYFSRWQIDVTTEYPGIRPEVGWIIIGGPSPGNNLVGQAGIGNWTTGITDFPFATAFAGLVYADALGGNTDYIGTVAAHELGHLAGLLHDTGLMSPVFNPNDAQWSAASLAQLDRRFELASVPEPSVLWLGLVGFWVLGRRTHRHNRQSQPRPSCSGTSMISSTRVNKASRLCRKASSGLAALTQTSPGLSNSLETSRFAPLIRNLIRGLMRFAGGAHTNGGN